MDDPFIESSCALCSCRYAGRHCASIRRTKVSSRCRTIEHRASTRECHTTTTSRWTAQLLRQIPQKRRRVTRRSSSDGGSIWGVDKLQEACLGKTPPSRKEVIEGQDAIPLILQDDELLEAQQGTVSASATGDLARTAGGHGELIYDEVFPYS
jgi:hypothetical protein